RTKSVLVFLTGWLRTGRARGRATSLAANPPPKPPPRMRIFFFSMSNDPCCWGNDPCCYDLSSHTYADSDTRQVASAPSPVEIGAVPGGPKYRSPVGSIAI